MNQELKEESTCVRQRDWTLVCSANNWEEPVPIDLGELRLLETLSQKLNLTITRDDKRKKVYLCPAGGSFGEAHLTTDSADTSENASFALNPNKPSAKGLSFLSDWTAHIIPDEEAGEEYECVDEETAAPLISAFPDHQVSKNFRLSEFRPGEHAYDLIRLSPRLVNVLEEIRARAGGQTLEVLSGYRPPAYNQRLGSISNSTHVDGIAADITSEYVSVSELYDICDRIIGERGGVGYYPTQGFVHVDLRGYGARW